MYSSLCYIMQRDGTSISISTVEDPVEFNLPMVSQTQINPPQGFSYATALRSIMRQDPQVIMVGEIRDPETAAIAVQAGLTGHLVLSTIHSGVSAGAFTRLINMEIEPFMLASSMLGVMGLRLMRSNCPDCARPYEPESSQLKVLPEALLPDAQFRRGIGCDRCNQTGYAGRLPVSELLVVNEPFREAVMKKMPTSALEDIAIQQGMRNPVAKRASTGHHRPDHPRRNHSRAGLLPVRGVSPYYWHILPSRLWPCRALPETPLTEGRPMANAAPGGQ